VFGIVLRISASIIFVLGPMFYFGITADAAKMGIAAAAGAAAAMLFNIDKLTSFKLLGFEAKLKEAIQEAYATLDAVQDLAAVAVAVNVRLVTRGGRVGANLGIADSIAAVEKLRGAASKLNVEGNREIRRALEEHYHLLSRDYFGEFRKTCGDQIATNADLTRRVVVEPDWLPPREELENVFREAGLEIPEKAHEALEDYLYYRANHRPRRPFPID
jgi:hypothetical protein